MTKQEIYNSIRKIKSDLKKYSDYAVAYNRAMDLIEEMRANNPGGPNE